MSEEAVVSKDRTPRHLWIVGVLSLLWYLVAVYDYLATQTQSESYMSKFTPEQLEYFYGFPTWVVAFWALAVWVGLMGTILLLLRKRHAAGAFLVSLISLIVTSFYNYVLTNGLEIMGGAALAFTGLIFVIALGLWLYARAMAQRGVLT